MDYVDFATPMTKMEKLLKDMYKLTLEKKGGEALALSPELITEARILQNMLKLEFGGDDAV
jgi:hypothetical protein